MHRVGPNHRTFNYAPISYTGIDLLAALEDLGEEYEVELRVCEGRYTAKVNTKVNGKKVSALLFFDHMLEFNRQRLFSYLAFSASPDFDVTELSKLGQMLVEKMRKSPWSEVELRKAFENVQDILRVRGLVRV